MGAANHNFQKQQTNMIYLMKIVIFLVAVTGLYCVEYKIGMIVQQKCCAWDSMDIIGGALNIALDYLENDGAIENVTFRIIMKETREESDGVANVVSLVRDDDVDVIFGSPSSRICVPAAHLTSNWNFPHISWVASSGELSDKDRFGTFVRTFGPFSKIGIAFVAIFEKFNWKKASLLHVDYATCLYASESIYDMFGMANITVANRIEYPIYDATMAEITGYLIRLKRTSRIIILCDNDRQRDIMIKACEVGMCNGEYVFVYPAMTVAENYEETKPWYRGDDDDQKAREAYRYMLYVSYANWYDADGRDTYTTFMQEVIDRTADPPWNDDSAKRNNLTAGVYSQYLFDAMYFYGLWVNHTRVTGDNHRDGRAMLQFSNHLAFTSAISGPVHFQNGDRIPLYWIWDFSHKDGFPRIAAIANTGRKTNIIEEGQFKGFKWQTEDGKVPLDVPVCGFYRELCPPIENDNTVVIISACLSIVALTAAGSIIAYILRKRQLELNMMKMIWKIDIDDIELQKPKYGTGSKIDIQKSMSQLSLRTKSTETIDANAVINAAKVGALTSVGIFKGQVVAIKSLSSTMGELTRNDLMELKEMRELQHDNIAPFIGACLDTASPCALFLYCPKGSLQDILENDDINLDMVFKHSLMLDLAEGMYYLHCSALGSHGRLKSSNCLVDNRWVLRITDYGLNRFLDSVCVEKVEEFQHYKSLLWTAPELLRAQRVPRNGTKEGDVYSFGIILHEIFYRMGTFAGLGHITVKDIIGKVRNREIPACRPKLFSDVGDLSPAVSKLMQLCWSDAEFSRPTFGNIRTYIKKNIKGTNKNIVDVILQRLEKYASNLEDLVDQRTMQLMDEKQKTDKLLYRMLPPSCAEQLKAGEMVQPELYESATVFFSDIVGFTTIAAMSTPIQVIDLLNDLYTCFDDIIAQHDAYKAGLWQTWLVGNNIVGFPTRRLFSDLLQVETIGDAYLVVSGIPTRNGEKHAGEIADMSLHILSALMKFKLHHLPEVKVNVRIGMHTGPCCAGVVGLSMPRYCIFGDTVNTASRMESNGVEQRIHMSEASSIALRQLGGYLITTRGEIDVKGKGKMRTYWLDGKEGFEKALPRLAE